MDDKKISLQDERILAQTLHNIILATYQLKLYDNENALFLQSVDTVMGFADILALKFGSIRLANTGGKLLINGIAIATIKEEKIWADNFLGLMKKSDLNSIDVYPGINHNEIIVFLKGIAKKKGLSELQKEFTAQNVDHIKLNVSAPAAAAIRQALPKIEEQAPVVLETAKSPVPEQNSSEPVLTVKDTPEEAKTAVFVNGANEEGINTSLQKLAALGEHKPVKDLIDKISADLSADDRSDRLKATTLLSNIFNAFKDAGNRDVTRYIGEELKAVLEKEHDGKIYSELRECLKEEINQEILEGHYANAVRLVAVFQRHEEEGRKSASPILERLIQKQNVTLLLNDLLNENPEKRDHALEILITLKNYLYPQFLQSLAETENLRKRRMLAAIIKLLGNNAVPELIGMMNEQLSIIDTIRIIEVLDSFPEQPTVYIKLNELIRHYDFKVRKEALMVLSRLATKEALPIMVKALNDINILIKQEAVRLLGNVAYAGAIKGLKSIAAPRIPFIKEEDEALQVEAVLALGRIKNPETVLFLKDILIANFWIKPKSSRIRGAVVTALAAIGTPECAKLLKRAARDIDKTVRQTAETVMKTSTKN